MLRAVASMRLRVCTAAVRKPPIRSCLMSVRYSSTVTHYDASKGAPREVPTRLLVVSASSWAKEPAAQVSLSSFVQSFVGKGWNVTCVDLDPEGLESLSDSQQILASLEDELKQTLRSNGSPFPPLMVTQGLSSLIAETYVSSNSLSGLALFNPPLSAEHACKQYPEQLPTPLPLFTYEPHFPCLVAWNDKAAKELAFWDVHRIEEAREEEAGEAMDRYVWDFDSAEDKDKAGAFELQRWADEQGISDAEGEDEETYDEEPTEETERKLPIWYEQGSYQRNPTRSKKEPLLLDDKDLEESFIRGSGPGGQAINKLATCVQLKHKPTGRVIRCQETRSRQENRMHARRRMSKELERLVFGEGDSAIGQKALRERRKKMAKDRKRRRKEGARVEEQPE